MLAATGFIQLYATATETQGVILGAAAIPNITFVLGLVLYMVFTYDENTHGSGSRRSGFALGRHLVNGRTQAVYRRDGLVPEQLPRSRNTSASDRDVNPFE